MNEQERQEIVQDTNEEYPLVALKNIVVFPHNRHALTVAREKSVRAIEEAWLRPEHLLVAAKPSAAALMDGLVMSG